MHKLVLLDQDRVEQDIAAGRDAAALAVRYELEIIFQEPDLEGLLYRLHPGQEQRHLAAGSSTKELQRVWSEYRNAPTVDQLKQRFKLADVRRAA